MYLGHNGVVGRDPWGIPLCNLFREDIVEHFPHLTRGSRKWESYPVFNPTGEGTPGLFLDIHKLGSGLRRFYA